MYKINRWIDIENSIDDNIWNNLSLNPNPIAIYLLEQNPDRIYWYWFALNPNAIDFLKKIEIKLIGVVYHKIQIQMLSNY